MEDFIRNILVSILLISFAFIYCSEENNSNLTEDIKPSDTFIPKDIVDTSILPDIVSDQTTHKDVTIPNDSNEIDVFVSDTTETPDTETQDDSINFDTVNPEDISDTTSDEIIVEDVILDTEADISNTDVGTTEPFRLDSPKDGEHFKKLTPVLFKGYTPAPFIVLAEGYYKFAEWNSAGDFEFTYSFYGTGNREISFVIDGKTELVIHITIEEPDKTFAQYILETIELLIKEDSNLGYGDGQHTRSLYYNGDLIFAVKDRTSHCVGITMQTLVMAMNKYYADTQDSRVWNMPSSWLKWEPFKHCWYVDSAIKCYGARDALVKYGLGEKVDDFSKLKPADFVNYDRTNGTGHSVIFLNYLYDDGTSGIEYKSNAIGFKYFSSQGSTNGAGYKNAFFEGFCSDKFTNKDCGIIKSSLVMGRVWEPANFIPQNQGIAPLYPSDYDGSGFVNLEYFNDTGAETLK